MVNQRGKLGLETVRADECPFHSPFPGTRISTVTATGWNWGSSSHTLTSSGQGKSLGAWRKVWP